MSLNVRILFEQPQREIASILRDKMRLCRAAWIVTGFATVEGVEAVALALVSQPSKLRTFIVGSGTYRGFEALDKLISRGVDPNCLYVHLGHSRSTGPDAKYRFYRYHPMLHSKVYLLEMDDGTAVAIIGSHNVTGFALLGLNGEAAVVVEGPVNDPEMQKVRQHIQESLAQSVRYSPLMKEAFTWWTSQFVEGFREKVNDQPRDSESKRTIVIIGVESSGDMPRKDDVIYFEIPEALHQINALNTEVHIFVFDAKPASPWDALMSLDQAKSSLSCTVLGLEKEQGGRELEADWELPDRSNPVLARTLRPFRPSPSLGMLQVRVKVGNELRDRYEYFFEVKKLKWEPVFDRQRGEQVGAEEIATLTSLDLIPREDKKWFLVSGLRPIGAAAGAYHDALREFSPDSGSYVLVSLRRRKIRHAK
jgi:hypothetical protein